MIPVLSISIPTYNRAGILEQTLDALFSQIETHALHNDVEVIVSDNNSGDNTHAVVKKYADQNKYRLIYHKNKTNLGVIRNILELLPLCSGEFWMFYGDDDKIPNGNLPLLVSCLKQHNDMPVFMFRQFENQSPSFKNYVIDSTLSIQDMASSYFYYIGNAGVFAIKRDLAYKAQLLNYNNLLNTCWPQTEIFFIAAHLSKLDKPVYSSTIESMHAYIGNLNYNSAYYFFETTLYSQLRSAISIESIIGKGFTSNARKSMYSVQFFETFEQIVIENYIYFDFENEKREFDKSLDDSLKTIPAEYRSEIDQLKKTLSTSLDSIKDTLYKKYRKQNARFNQMPFFKRWFYLTPMGYKRFIKNKKAEKINFYKQKGKKIITAESGYF